jgi:hypothetical protein
MTIAMAMHSEGVIKDIILEQSMKISKIGQSNRLRTFLDGKLQ